MTKKKATRIILTGAQGTGKTTLMNELAKDGIRTISHIRKTAAENNFDTKNATEESQKTYFKTLKKELSSKRSYISDRGLTCVAAYTFDKAISGDIAKKVADKLSGMCKTDRESYEKYWDDISPFVKFGCLKDDKLCFREVIDS